MSKDGTTVYGPYRGNFVMWMQDRHYALNIERSSPSVKPTDPWYLVIERGGASVQVHFFPTRSLARAFKRLLTSREAR